MELRDDSGKILDEDPDGRLAFLLTTASASDRTLGVRDFAIAPAASSHGVLVLHARRYSPGTGSRAVLPEVSIPVRLDLRTTRVMYAVPAGNAFGEAVVNNVESDSAHRVPMKAAVNWRSTTLLYVNQPCVAARPLKLRLAHIQGRVHGTSSTTGELRTRLI